MCNITCSKKNSWHNALINLGGYLPQKLVAFSNGKWATQTQWLEMAIGNIVCVGPKKSLILMLKTILQRGKHFWTFDAFLTLWTRDAILKIGKILLKISGKQALVEFFLLLLVEILLRSMNRHYWESAELLLLSCPLAKMKKWIAKTWFQWIYLSWNWAKTE